eukprot:8456340-Alexandrium_andersonii.AAC.1
MAASTGLSASSGVAGQRPAWPVGVPAALRDPTAQMAEESTDQLLRQPEASVRQADGGEHSQQAVDAVWSVVQAT